MTRTRDHGGGIDAAAAAYGGTRRDWLDLSTGINPIPYSVGNLPTEAWTALPDRDAQTALTTAARDFWRVPDNLGILAAPGASALIARLPHVLGQMGRAYVAKPTYNEWEATFRQSDWALVPDPLDADVGVFVHPNNPDGALAPSRADVAAPVVIYDESFADCAPPDISRVAQLGPQDLVVKSFGKFWGLAGVRLGFLIGAPECLENMAEALGPWPVSGPALELGRQALADTAWAGATRARLAQDSARLDALFDRFCNAPRGTDLFRLYEAEAAQALHRHLAQAKIWTRVFPYDQRWLRVGLPGSAKDWDRVKTALARA